jgi:hypothetical protein
MTRRTIGRVVGAVDELVYCVFPGWGRSMAIGVPLQVFADAGVVPLVGYRFYCQATFPSEQPATADDFAFALWEFPGMDRRAEG